MKINILPSEIYNKISAGEVIESPASVVKELVENAIDAGARSITVSVEDGGMLSITVADDGSGIAREEIHKTILPHATSKVTCAEDLFRLGTLGFRGEALASIASVAYVEIKSRTANEAIGSRLVAKCCEPEITDCVREVGTTVTIRELFYNTPARLKFMRSKSAEAGSVAKTFLQIALANPYIKMRLVDDGKLVYETHGEGLREAIGALYGEAVARDTVELRRETEEVSLTGFITLPTTFRGNRTAQTLIVNGRVVEDSDVNGAVQNACSKLFLHRQFPIYVIDIKLDVSKIDVNVHPAKRQIRFENPRKVTSAVYRAIEKAYDNYYTERQKEMFSGKSVKTEEVEPFSVADVVARTDEDIAGEEELEAVSVATTTENRVKYDIDTILAYSVGSDYVSNPQSIDRFIIEDERTEKQVLTVKEKRLEIDGRFRVVGQVFDTYLIIELNRQLIILDQHAAHERIIFDTLIENASEKENVSQPLLAPFVFSGGANSVAFLLSISARLTEIGFEFDAISSGAVAVRAVPTILVGCDIGKLLEGICENYKFLRTEDITEVRDRLAKISCKKAIKGGQVLSDTQIAMFVDYYLSEGAPIFCPHGRPTIVSFTLGELERLFRRRV